MKNILPTEVNTAISKLEKAGHKAYVVGGAVRDFFPEDFGKTVFLSRKEAEASMKGGAR